MDTASASLWNFLQDEIKRTPNIMIDIEKLIFLQNTFHKHRIAPPCLLQCYSNDYIT